MLTGLLIFHIVISLLLIATVLMQSGKGSSISNIFGGGGMETVFGAETPKILNRITSGLAILFMINCLILTGFSNKLHKTSVIERALQKTAPAAQPSSPQTIPPVPAVPVPEK